MDPTKRRWEEVMAELSDDAEKSTEENTQPVARPTNERPAAVAYIRSLRGSVAGLIGDGDGRTIWGGMGSARRGD